MATTCGGGFLVSVTPGSKWVGNAKTMRSTASVAVNAYRNRIVQNNEKLKRSKRDYFELAKSLIRYDGGPPRWFSPLDIGLDKSRMENSPLLLYLPGFDGLGIGLVLQHQKLDKLFDVWCLHIPIKDRTPFQELVMMVEEIVRSENERCPKKPIYIVGESIGGCLALAVAARNPNLDILLILANPATNYTKWPFQFLQPLLEVIPSELITDEPLSLFLSIMENKLDQLTSMEQPDKDLDDISVCLSALADILPKESLMWKLQMMKSASTYANSRLHAVKAQILILASGRDPLLASMEEAERIRKALPKQEIQGFKDVEKMPKCEIRKFYYSDHFLFLDDGFDLVTVIKGTNLYRRGQSRDHIYDYIPPTEAESIKANEQLRLLYIATDPVMLSILEDDRIVRGLEGIPDKGPLILVGNHMLSGIDVFSIVTTFLFERNILLRGLGHPTLFTKTHEDALDIASMVDPLRLMGVVPVSSCNFYKLLSSGAHVLLYPGGAREAFPKKGENYELFWPERSEFVRMAARFGATIIPFGVVGVDDICELILDYEDQTKIPFFGEAIANWTKRQTIQLRVDSEGEVANQIPYIPGVLPKFPGRFYYMFGKPIDTSEMKQELRDKEKAQELYLKIKLEVKRCVSYLKENREKDPYRSLASRTFYQALHGCSTHHIPTFDLY